MLGINNDKSPPYRPEANGAIERVNGTLKTILRKLVDQEKCSWENYLPLALMAYRTMAHLVTCHSPFKMIYGRIIILPGLVDLQMANKAGDPEEYMKI